MVWSPEYPDIPISKPQAIINLEKLGPDRLQAMSPQEMDDRLQEAADALAGHYKKEVNQGYIDCVQVVSVTLKLTGEGLDGKVGAYVVGKCDKLAHSACRIVYPDNQ